MTKLTHKYQLSQMQNDTSDVIKDKSLSQGFANPVVKNVTEHIDTKSIQPLSTGDAFKAKIAALTKAGSGVGKKLMGAVPLLGAGYAALSGEPAMAAEELVSDASDLAGPLAAKLGAGAAAGPIGLAAMGAQQALQSSGAGMSPEDEKLMLAEIDAQKDYNNSPAKLARINALKSLNPR